MSKALAKGAKFKETPKNLVIKTSNILMDYFFKNHVKIYHEQNIKNRNKDRLSVTVFSYPSSSITAQDNTPSSHSLKVGQPSIIQVIINYYLITINYPIILSHRTGLAHSLTVWPSVKALEGCQEGMCIFLTPFISFCSTDT